jgi:hypothetical protein
VAEQYISLVQEKTMVQFGQTASVLNHFLQVVETDALKAVLPVFVKALTDIETMVQSDNNVTLSQMGAQFVADMATAMPALELDAIQTASQLYQKILAVMAARASATSTTTTEAVLVEPVGVIGQFVKTVENVIESEIKPTT